jgi:outer membrane protein TolC
LTAVAAEQAYQHYICGLEPYFDALSAEISRQNLQVSELQARYDVIEARVQLNRAVGGNWEEILDNTKRTVGGEEEREKDE